MKPRADGFVRRHPGPVYMLFALGRRW